MIFDINGYPTYPESRKIRDIIRDAIDKLPSSGGYEIAAALSRLSVYGCRNSPDSCPIAQYIKKTCNVRVRVHTTKILIYGEMALSTPVAVCEFINDFDDGCYPELVLSDQDEDL